MFRALAGTPALGPDRSRQRGDTSSAGDPHVRFDERGVETEAMVEPLRHRRTKGAAKRYARPTAAPPHLDSLPIRDVASNVSNAQMVVVPLRSALMPQGRRLITYPSGDFAKLQAVCVVDLPELSVVRAISDRLHVVEIRRHSTLGTRAPAQRRRSADAMSAAAVPADHHRHSGPRV